MLECLVKTSFGKKKQETENCILHSRIISFQSLIIMESSKKESRVFNNGNCFQRLGSSHRHSGLKSGHFYQ